jgi:8-oxo-dGTP diphosphatase
MKSVKRKVIAYVTHGQRLLVFRHRDFPEAGIQAPAGTLEEGEAPAEGALREGWEETGLERLRLAEFLGEDMRDMAEWGLDQVHHRHFFHLTCGDEPPEAWQHNEETPSDGSPGPIVLEFHWAPLPAGAPELSGGQGEMLPRLMEAMRLGGARP